MRFLRANRSNAIGAMLAIVYRMIAGWPIWPVRFGKQPNVAR